MGHSVRSGGPPRGARAWRGAGRDPAAAAAAAARLTQAMTEAAEAAREEGLAAIQRFAASNASSCARMSGGAADDPCACGAFRLLAAATACTRFPRRRAEPAAEEARLGRGLEVVRREQRADARGVEARERGAAGVAAERRREVRDSAGGGVRGQRRAGVCVRGGIRPQWVPRPAAASPQRLPGPSGVRGGPGRRTGVRDGEDVERGARGEEAVERLAEGLLHGEHLEAVAYADQPLDVLVLHLEGGWWGAAVKDLRGWCVQEESAGGSAPRCSCSRGS